MLEGALGNQHNAPSLHNVRTMLKQDDVSIGYGAAEALLEAGALVTIISSSPEKVKNAVARLNNPNASSAVANVREETAFVDILRSLAPVDHIVFSGVDKIIRGKLEDLELEDAKYLFGVKFWGAVVTGKGWFGFHNLTRDIAKQRDLCSMLMR